MAEQLVNEFTVNRPIDEAWAVITDVERIAPCLPGAQLQEIEGETYRGIVKIKLGSITPQFKGQANFLQRDDEAHRAVLKAEGSRHGWARQCIGGDRRARGEPVADQHSRGGDDRSAHHRQGRPVRTRHHRRRLEEDDGAVRRELEHDARRSARGSGIVQRRRGRGHGHVAASSSRKMPALPTATTDRAAARKTPARAADQGPAAAPVAEPKVRKVDSPASEPVDLAGVAGPAILKRLIPIVVVLLVAILVVRRRR